jgi:hypothetical protein
MNLKSFEKLNRIYIIFCVLKQNFFINLEVDKKYIEVNN